MQSGQEPRQAYSPAEFRLSVAPMMDWFDAAKFRFIVRNLQRFGGFL
jgi:hypothetical protein